MRCSNFFRCDSFLNALECWHKADILKKIELNIGLATEVAEIGSGSSYCFQFTLFDAVLPYDPVLRTW